MYRGGRGGACRNAPGLRALEQAALHDYRMVRYRAQQGPAVSASQPLNRRKVLARGSLLCSALALGGCQDLAENPDVLRVLDLAESLNHKLHRLLLPQTVLAREYSEADISAAFRANGSTDPDDDDYRALARDSFKDWRVEFGGLVRRAASYSLDDLRRLPPRTQITRRDCVEGWSCIGKWKGVPLANLIDEVGLSKMLTAVWKQAV